MKRGGPIQRRTPMTRTAIVRNAVDRQQGRTPNPPKHRARKRSGLKRPSMDPVLRAAVFDRARGLCDRCGHGIHPEAWECHHRKLRSRGGEDSFENLVALCPGCHHWAHANPQAATGRGFIVPSFADPASVPVLRHGFGLWFPVGPVWIEAHLVTFTAPPNRRSEA